MPTTVILEHHKPRLHPAIPHTESQEQFLQKSCPYEISEGKSYVLASSFQNTILKQKVYASSSSFVRSAIEAWARHSHLVLRPDDFWFQILVQLNLFMTKNGECLRDLFVSHEGKEEIIIVDESWANIIGLFELELQERVKTPWLAEWISPGFSTSRPDDDLTAIVLMMGLMSTFFEYAAEEICGIPSITLMGQKDDWERLLGKIDRLADFGEEPEDYQRRLCPLLSRIVRTFDDPSCQETKDFWDQLVHAKVKHDNMCGRPPLQYTISGWVLGFFYWDDEGKAGRRFSRGLGTSRFEPGSIVLDGIHYGEEFLEHLPFGYGKVTVKSVKQEGQSETDRALRWLVAGNIGKSITDGAPAGYFHGHGDTQAMSTDARKSSEDGVTSGALKGSRNGLVGILWRLSCLCGTSDKEPESATPRKTVNEKRAAASNVADKTTFAPGQGHSTIQPLSGWALFGPQKDLGPFMNEEEISGPTVDAIKSCGAIEHYRA